MDHPAAKLPKVAALANGMISEIHEIIDSHPSIGISVWVHDLPEELLQGISRFVPTHQRGVMRLVCSSWCEAISKDVTQLQLPLAALTAPPAWQASLLASPMPPVRPATRLPSSCALAPAAAAAAAAAAVSPREAALRRLFSRFPHARHLVLLHNAVLPPPAVKRRTAVFINNNIKRTDELSLSQLGRHFQSPQTTLTSRFGRELERLVSPHWSLERLRVRWLMGEAPRTFFTSRGFTRWVNAMTGVAPDRVGLIQSLEFAWAELSDGSFDRPIGGGAAAAVAGAADGGGGAALALAPPLPPWMPEPYHAALPPPPPPPDPLANMNPAAAAMAMLAGGHAEADAVFQAAMDGHMAEEEAGLMGHFLGQGDRWNQLGGLSDSATAALGLRGVHAGGGPAAAAAGGLRPGLPLSLCAFSNLKSLSLCCMASHAPADHLLRLLLRCRRLEKLSLVHHEAYASWPVRRAQLDLMNALEQVVQEELGVIESSTPPQPGNSHHHPASVTAAAAPAAADVANVAGAAAEEGAGRASGSGGTVGCGGASWWPSDLVLRLRELQLPATPALLALLHLPRPALSRLEVLDLQVIMAQGFAGALGGSDQALAGTARLVSALKAVRASGARLRDLFLNNVDLSPHLLETITQIDTLEQLRQFFADEGGKERKAGALAALAVLVLEVVEGLWVPLGGMISPPGWFPRQRKWQLRYSGLGEQHLGREWAVAGGLRGYRETEDREEVEEEGGVEVEKAGEAAAGCGFPTGPQASDGTAAAAAAATPAADGSLIKGEGTWPLPREPTTAAEKAATAVAATAGLPPPPPPPPPPLKFEPSAASATLPALKADPWRRNAVLLRRWLEAGLEAAAAADAASKAPSCGGGTAAVEDAGGSGTDSGPGPSEGSGVPFQPRSQRLHRAEGKDCGGMAQAAAGCASSAVDVDLHGTSGGVLDGRIGIGESVGVDVVAAYAAQVCAAARAALPGPLSDAAPAAATTATAGAAAGGSGMAAAAAAADAAARALGEITFSPSGKLAASIAMFLREFGCFLASVATLYGRGRRQRPASGQSAATAVAATAAGPATATDAAAAAIASADAEALAAAETQVDAAAAYAVMSSAMSATAVTVTTAAEYDTAAAATCATAGRIYGGLLARLCDNTARGRVGSSRGGGLRNPFNETGLLLLLCEAIRACSGTLRQQLMRLQREGAPAAMRALRAGGMRGTSHTESDLVTTLLSWAQLAETLDAVLLAAEAALRGVAAAGSDTEHRLPVADGPSSSSPASASASIADPAAAAVVAASASADPEAVMEALVAARPAGQLRSAADEGLLSMLRLDGLTRLTRLRRLCLDLSPDNSVPLPVASTLRVLLRSLPSLESLHVTDQYCHPEKRLMGSLALPGVAAEYGGGGGGGGTLAAAAANRLTSLTLAARQPRRVWRAYTADGTGALLVPAAVNIHDALAAAPPNVAALLAPLDRTELSGALCERDMLAHWGMIPRNLRALCLHRVRLLDMPSDALTGSRDEGLLGPLHGDGGSLVMDAAAMRSHVPLPLPLPWRRAPSAVPALLQHLWLSNVTLTAPTDFAALLRELLAAAPVQATGGSPIGAALRLLSTALGTSDSVCNGASNGLRRQQQQQQQQPQAPPGGHHRVGRVRLAFGEIMASVAKHASAAQALVASATTNATARAPAGDARTSQRLVMSGEEVGLLCKMQSLRFLALDSCLRLEDVCRLAALTALRTLALSPNVVASEEARARLDVEMASRYSPSLQAALMQLAPLTGLRGLWLPEWAASRAHVLMWQSQLAALGPALVTLRVMDHDNLWRLPTPAGCPDVADSLQWWQAESHPGGNVQSPAVYSVALHCHCLQPPGMPSLPLKPRSALQPSDARQLYKQQVLGLNVTMQEACTGTLHCLESVQDCTDHILREWPLHV
ncbi:hypothetical protein VOLCADRAFT_98366 [Volvox carteri f. nagariensis]|uniref:F-box domain-containing protein n=1 Tax=Volvox carteri f. nagariensis TaxID=3068 RepID=D8UF57_VOLCA|nr:uncharacterized protein VOLCADRAFT_98366 [Volvox carteri f. nagariensis]EFJ41659.1 hypothetical protein VOLCADRAFT_98366 [Volvox carteri f. nagariensis]|eukprot:XP_002957315.1 hypothetical protein VOLCADRAFT_98366 [Volvox carteri f. nagariensis]